MMEKKIYEGILMDENISFSLPELCEVCHADEAEVREMIEVGIIEPIQVESGDWVFTLIQLQKFQKAQRLKKDLLLDLNGVALGIELIEEILKLRSEISELKQKIHLIKISL